MRKRKGKLKKKVLLISPYFPPHKAIGTKRAINFVQGVHGKDDWEVIVLASKPFNDNIDPKLNNHISSDVIVDYGFVGLFRPIIKYLSGGSKPKKESSKNPKSKNLSTNAKPSAKKGSLTPFDQYLWDVNSAVTNGKRLIKKFQPDVIWVNADPWSGFIVAHKLSKIFGIPWVADMRDPWSVFQMKMELRPTITQKMIRFYEKKFFSSATKVVLNSEASYQAYVDIYPPSISKKLTFIRNAFNPIFLPLTGKAEKKDAFIFGYFGGFRPFVPSDFILKGFAEFVKRNELKPSEVQLEVTGSVYDEFWLQVSTYEIESFVKVNKAINAEGTIPLLRSWDVLLMIAIHDLRWQMPAKFYDYLFARKPILAVSDYGELNTLIERTNSGKWAKTNEDEKIVQLFESFYQEGKGGLLDNERLIESYGSQVQSMNFRKILDNVIS